MNNDDMNSLPPLPECDDFGGKAYFYAETVSEYGKQCYYIAASEQASTIAALKEQKEQFERMFMAACEDLGAINEALNLDPNDGGADPILGAIEDLRADALEEAAKACESECVDDTGSDGDIGYNNAIKHAAAAIRALASQTAAPVQPKVSAALPSRAQIIEASGDVLLRGVRAGEIEYDVALVAELASRGWISAPPAQQPDDVRDTNGKIYGGDVNSNQVFVSMDEKPSAELWTVGKRCYLAATRPSAALTDEQIVEIANEQGARNMVSPFTHPKGPVTAYQFKVSDGSLQKFARAILAASGGVEQVPVAWAVTAERGGIHKLAIKRESAERKAEAWRVEWPNNNCRVRPLVFGDVAPATQSNKKEG